RAATADCRRGIHSTVSLRATRDSLVATRILRRTLAGRRRRRTGRDCERAMLLTISLTTPPATDLGFLLHKNPSRAQSFKLGFGQAHVFYPEATAERCTAALLLDVDPVGLVRGRGGGSGSDQDGAQYVSDRPYVASSFLSVAIGEVFGTALAG